VARAQKLQIGQLPLHECTHHARSCQGPCRPSLGAAAAGSPCCWHQALCWCWLPQFPRPLDSNGPAQNRPMLQPHPMQHNKQVLQAAGGASRWCSWWWCDSHSYSGLPATSSAELPLQLEPEKMHSGRPSYHPHDSSETHITTLCCS